MGWMGGIPPGKAYSLNENGMDGTHRAGGYRDGSSRRQRPAAAGRKSLGTIGAARDARRLAALHSIRRLLLQCGDTINLPLFS